MRERDLSRLITSRAAKHLRQAALIISAAACLIVAVMSVFEWQYNRAREEFLDNPRVHFVDVSVHFDGTTVKALGWDDVATVTSVATREARGAARVAPVYGIGFGISVPLPDDNWTSVQVFGIPEGSAWALGLDALEPGVGYCATLEGPLELHVTHMRATAEGWEGNEFTPMQVPVMPLPQAAPITLFALGYNHDLYVDESTFAAIAELTRGEAWDAIRSQMGPDDPWGIEMMPHIYIYLDRLGDVARVAEATRGYDYVPMYVMEAFRAIPETLQTGFWTGLAVALLALAVGLTLAIVLTRSYLRLSHKDMGILKHMGCPAPRLRGVYARPVRRTLLAAWVAGVALALALGLCLRLGGPFIALNVAMPTVMVGAVLLWALVREMPRHVRLPVLELLKLNREFE